MSANNVEHDCKLMLQEMGLSGPLSRAQQTPLSRERRVLLSLGRYPWRRSAVPRVPD